MEVIDNTLVVVVDVMGVGHDELYATADVRVLSP